MNSNEINLVIFLIFPSQKYLLREIESELKHTYPCFGCPNRPIHLHINHNTIDWKDNQPFTCDCDKTKSRIERRKFWERLLYEEEDRLIDDIWM